MIGRRLRVERPAPPRASNERARWRNSSFSTNVHGSADARVFAALDGSVLLVHQARYGSDGDHSENRLKIFRFRDGRAEELLDQNIDFVEFVEEGGALRVIRGKYVESLCHACDGWDAAEPDDVFLVPIASDVATRSVTPELADSEKARLLSRLEQRVARNTAEQRGYGSVRYSAFAASVAGRIRELLGRR